MVARLHLYKAKPESLFKVQGLVDYFAPILKARRGYKGATFFGNDKVGEYGSFVIWASKEDADAAAEALFPILKEKLSSIAKETVKHTLYDNIEPRGITKDK